MAHRFISLGVMCLFLVSGGISVDAEDWLVVWQGQDRPGPVNLPYTTGWPTDAAGFEQHDPNNCYDQPPGPDYAEAANVEMGGFLAIQNLMDGTCTGIGHIDGGACIAQYGLLQIRENPCGMRYQVGPRTVLNWFNNYNSEIMAYHGPDTTNTSLTGLTAEISFYIAQSPMFEWTTLIEIEGYPKYDNPWNTGGGDYHLNSYAQILLRHFMDGRPTDEWHLVAAADHTFDLGVISDYMNRWVTVRLGLAGAPGKPQMIVWVDGLIRHAAGWDAQGLGNDNGSSPHGYCRFGYNGTDGDIRIGTTAYTNQGVFSPNPRGECRDVFGDKYLRPLPSVSKTRANPEVCDNGLDDDGDGLVDCDDPECFQDGVCGNLLKNGSFEQVISPCDPTDCGSLDTRPDRWQSTGSGTVVAHGDQWRPLPPATDGYTRGSIAFSGGFSTAYQTVNVVPGTAVALKGDIATGHPSGEAFEHFVELVDGNQDTGTVIASFVETASTAILQPFSALSGMCQTGEATVRWGYRSTGGSGTAATHVDNLYLTGTPRGRCNNPFADVDFDGDVDQADFAVWQLCHTGDGGGPVQTSCECFDVDGPGGLPDNDIDQGDLVAFETCASGPGIPADPACDDNVVQPPFDIAAAGSRKQHGTVGAFDVDMLSPSAVEPRNGGPTKIVVTFDDDVQAADGSLDIDDEVTVSGASISQLTLLCDELTIELTSAADQSCVSVTLHGLALVSDATAIMPDRVLKVAVLFCDVNGDGVVNEDDESATIAGILQPVDSSTCRLDVDVDGDIDNIDALLVKVRIGTPGVWCP